jgi:hypothetical protein
MVGNWFKNTHFQGWGNLPTITSSMQSNIIEPYNSQKAELNEEHNTNNS